MPSLMAFVAAIDRTLMFMIVATQRVDLDPQLGMQLATEDTDATGILCWRRVFNRGQVFSRSMDTMRENEFG